MNHPRYSLPQRLIHWIAALAVLIALVLGLVLDAYGFDGLKDGFGIEVTNFVYKYHKTFGVLVLGLMTLRLVLRQIYAKPAYATPLTGFEASASRTVHAMLYVLLLVQPVLGWLGTAAGGYPVEFFSWTLPGLIGKDPGLSETLYGLHGAVGWTILALVGLHIGGALKHWLINRDGVMRRMSLF